MKKAALHSLGCKVNAYETDAMQQLLEEQGYEIVPFEEVADIYIINTCTVTNIADRKSRQMIHRAKKRNPNAIVVAAGCYVQTSYEQAREDECIDLIVGNNNKKDIAALIQKCEQMFDPEKQQAIQTERPLAAYMDINQTRVEYEKLHIDKTGEHTRAYVKIQDGCNQFCSYCMIPYARGRVRSRSREDIIEECTRLVANGYQELVLTGIHISSYGTDAEDESLLRLISEVHRIPGVERIRLGSLEPRIVTEQFVKEISALPKVCPHFHLSLQSGCDATLKRMRRSYTTKEYAAACQQLRNYYEHPAITTDIITGFPGETEEEFTATMKFVEKIGFYETHIFKYSKRLGTRAAVMENQVPETVKGERSSRLLTLNEQNSRLFREYYIGKEIEVLLEESVQLEGGEYLIGHTKEYVRAAVLKGQQSANMLCRGKAVDFLHNDLLLLKEAE